MRIFRVSHTSDAPPVHPVPDPDAFATEVLGRLSELEESTSIPSFQMADPAMSGSGFFNLSNKVLVFSKDVYLGEMGRSLGFSGNVHPTTLTDTGEELFFLNVTAVYNCLDISKTTFFKRRGEEVGVDHGMGIKEPAFLPKLIGDSFIFRLPQMKSAIFVASNGSGYEEDFYTIYQSAGASGLAFKEVWSGE